MRREAFAEAAELEKLAYERTKPLTDDPLRCYYTDEEWELVRTEPRAPSARELELARSAQADAWCERRLLLIPIGFVVALILTALLDK